MGGGLLQLVAYGAQDVYLTGNPQITFFKVVYRRHTNFAMEAIEQSFNGNNTFGSSVSVLITRNGDLIHRIYFNGKIKNSSAASTTAGETNSVALVPYFGQRLLKTIELEIGGQKIDKHYSEWLYIWNELSMTSGKKDGYRLMVGGDAKNRSILLRPEEKYEVYVPLEFWFCRNVGLALPLIALQYHEVKINITYASQAEMVDTASTNYTDVVDDATDNKIFDDTGNTVAGTNDITNPNNSELKGTASSLKLEDVGLWVDYIFLDTDERRRFAQLSHEYLIEQLQFTGSDTISASANGASLKSLRMTFNHPCKEIVWFVHGTDAKTYWNNYSDNVNNIYDVCQNPVLSAKIQLNGNDRFAERPGSYFSTVQPFEHHENVPSTYNNGINIYSFALKPEEHQPSGTLNMSRIDTAVLSMASSIAGNVSIYAVNYNVLRILSGMGGLAYSN
jgi:hypothetical protein